MTPSWSWPTSTATQPRSSVPPPSPGHRRRSSSAIWASRPTRHTSTSGSPTASSTRIHRFGRRRGSWRATSEGRRDCGPGGSPATFRSSWSRIHGPDDLDLVRNLLRAHEYWRLKLLTVDLVIVNEQGVSYAPGLRRRSRRSSAPASRSLVHDGDAIRGGVHLLRGDSLTAEDRTLLLSVARAVLVGRRGSLAEQVLRVDGPRRSPPAAAPRPTAPPARADVRPAATRAAVLSRLGGLAEQVGRPGRPGRGASAGRPSAVARCSAAADPGPRVLQWARWIRRRRPGVRHRPGAGTGHAGAVDQRRRQPVIRLPGLRVRVGIHLGGEQPREPADAVVERPGQRSGGRGHLPAGR